MICLIYLDNEITYVAWGVNLMHNMNDCYIPEFSDLIHRPTVGYDPNEDE